MTSHQISTFNLLGVSVDSHLLYPPRKKSFFLRDHNGNKAMQLFCVIPVIAPRIYFYFLFYITVQFLIVNLLQKAM